MRNIIKLSLILSCFCSIAALGLAGVNKITRPRIEMERIKAINEALKFVLPSSIVIKEKSTPDGNKYYSGFASEDTSQSPNGYAFITY